MYGSVSQPPGRTDTWETFLPGLAILETWKFTKISIKKISIIEFNQKMIRNAIQANPTPSWHFVVEKHDWKHI